MKPNLRVPVDEVRAGRATLDQRASHYVAVVHRKRTGDVVSVFGQGREATAEIVDVQAGAVTISIDEVRATLARREVTLLQAIGKGDKLDAIVRDATELGATKIVPVTTARTIVKLGDKASAKVDRWNTIAVDAARQCGRTEAPTVAAPVSFAAALDEAGDHRVLLSPTGEVALGPWLQASRSGSLVIAIGPEGGFSSDEVDAAAARGFTVARLGDVVLRTETVAAAVLGAVLVLDQLTP